MTPIQSNWRGVNTNAVLIKDGPVMIRIFVRRIGQEECLLIRWHRYEFHHALQKQA
jgi:hypothetical protein